MGVGHAMIGEGPVERVTAEQFTIYVTSGHISWTGNQAWRAMYYVHA